MTNGIPDYLTPFRFRLARIADSKVIIALVALYAAIVAVYAASANFSGKPTIAIVKSLLKVLGLIGDSFAVSLLIFSICVDRYSQNTYLARFTERAEKANPNMSPADVKQMLQVNHGELKNSTNNVLKSDVGATLLAISTVLALIGDLLGGL